MKLPSLGQEDFSFKQKKQHARTPLSTIQRRKVEFCHFFVKVFINVWYFEIVKPRVFSDLCMGRFLNLWVFESFRKKNLFSLKRFYISHPRGGKGCFSFFSFCQKKVWIILKTTCLFSKLWKWKKKRKMLADVTPSTCKLSEERCFNSKSLG